jgi:large subunit ribosomal protein L18e
MKINAEKSVVKDWLSTLDKASKGEHYGKLWKRVYRLVEVPERKRASVNLSKITEYTQDGDHVVVPGKVLATGAMNHKITIAAMEFSEPALKSLKAANCKVIDIKEMLKAEKVHVII